MIDGTTERRRQRRYPANFIAFFVGGGNRDGSGYTRNISEGGTFVETKIVFEPNTRLDVEMFLDLGNEVMPIRTQAEVAWCSEQGPRRTSGIGIRFVSMEEAAKQALQNTITRLDATRGEADAPVKS